MEKMILLQLLSIGRILVAGICGIMIGWERQNRRKAAGIKTHFIIAVASALMMVVSKYGFYDAIVSSGTSVDVSRVASGILAGVGIMGGGLVITGKQGLTSGITTAAGIWATVGIGMAIGAGMYVIGILSAFLIFFSQMLMHKSHKISKNFWRGHIDILFDKEKCDIKTVSSVLEAGGIDVIRIKCEKKEGNDTKIKVIFAVSTAKERAEIAELIDTIPNVCLYEF